MQDAVDSDQSGPNRLGIPDVTPHQLDLVGQIFRAARVLMHLRHHRIKDPDVMPGPQQLLGHMRTDEAGSAGDQCGRIGR
jgi:hypothetical protein